VKHVSMTDGHAAQDGGPVLVPLANTSGLTASLQDTPLLSLRLEAALGSRATLTILGGTRAGELFALERSAVLLGSARSADFVLDELGVSRRHAGILCGAERGCFIQDLGSTNGTFVDSQRVGFSRLRDGAQVQLGPHVVMRFTMLDRTAEALHRRLYESSVRDPLTRVFNRDYLAVRLAAELARAEALNHPTILMIDLDRMKQVNDQFGHFAGDRALCLAASTMLGAIRSEDVLARIGGDEFVILARTTDRTEVILLAERVRSAIEAMPMGAGEDARLTASVGGASLPELGTVRDPASALMALADRRMYRAKAAGGNRSLAT
jgi:two-component system cell cycle response regulator